MKFAKLFVPTAYKLLYLICFLNHFYFDTNFDFHELFNPTTRMFK